ncbi:FGGY-family carbohydrate kinase [Actinomadura flavalba]|uniref:FGGY-family carbohydrate kinase n=1 Tax=Actinomadura flavalba TaxID=1120938 RepID=UPI00035DE439|nr:FGGY family carbohydrate kinase [Actinomadura flavalba]
MSRDEAVFVGVDLGTQGVRALAVTAVGDVRGAGGHPLTGRRDGPRHEQDPEQWWTAVGAACRRALRDVPAGAVRGVAVDATSGTFLLTGADGRPLTPGLMYDDLRAAAQVERADRAGAEVWRRLGYRRMQPAWALPKLLWLLEHRRDLRGARLAHQTDFVNARLCGRPVATDLGSALKTGADLIAEDWPHDVLADLGVPAGLLPPLTRSGTPLGAVSPAAAEHTGLPPGTPVLAGCTDGCAAQLGTGRLTPGSWNSVLGTTLVLKGVTDDLLHDPHGVVYSHRAPDGRWLPGGASGAGGGVLARDFPGRDLAALDRAARRYEPSGAVTYPLVSAGERFPFVAPGASGFVLGRPRDEADRFASILQGAGYVERLCLDYLDLLGAPVGGDLTLTGGAARSAYWCRLRADILGRPVILPANAEPALGAAVLAASADRPPAETAAAMVRVRATLDPRPAHHARFTAGYLTLVAELERRGWLPPPVAAHARRSASG